MTAVGRPSYDLRMVAAHVEMFALAVCMWWLGDLVATVAEEERELMAMIETATADIPRDV